MPGRSLESGWGDPTLGKVYFSMTVKVEGKKKPKSYRGGLSRTGGEGSRGKSGPGSWPKKVGGSKGKKNPPPSERTPQKKGKGNKTWLSKGRGHAHRRGRTPPFNQGEGNLANGWERRLPRRGEK